MRKTSQIILIIIVLAVYCFAFQGARPLLDPDEGRYSAVALQMIESGDWLVPRTHPQQEHWTKPPLTYWAIAGSLLALGHNELAVRTPNVLSFFFTVIACYFLGRIFTPGRPWLVALVFATFVFPATVCNGATTDYPVTLWETVAVCCFAHALWGQNPRTKSLWTVLMWVSFGVAFLTKGAPALLPLLCIIIFLNLKSGKVLKFNARWGLGTLVLLAVGGSWFWIVFAQKPALLHYYVWNEFILRIFTPHHQRHSEWYAAFYIFLPVLVFGALPWLIITCKGLHRNFSLAKSWREPNLTDEAAKSVFLKIWLVVPLLIFAVAQSKLPLYVLPLFVPLAIMTAGQLEAANIDLRRYRLALAAWCVLLVAARPIMASLDYRRDASKFARVIHQVDPNTVDEFVFVGTVAAYGLKFYTGTDVKHVGLDAGELGREFQKDTPRLWFTLKEDAPLFGRLAEELGQKLRPLETITAREDYVLFAKERSFDKIIP